MRRQLSALLWRLLAPTLEVAREEGREEVRAAVRPHHDPGDPRVEGAFCPQCAEPWPCATIRALESVPPDRAVIALPHRTVPSRVRPIGQDESTDHKGAP